MRPHARGALVSLAILAACAGGPMRSTATDTDATASTGPATTATTATDGVSSTIAASSMTLTATTGETGETDGTTDLATTTRGECPTPESHECDMWAQDCCEGEKCSPWASGGGAWDAWKCVAVAPRPDAIGELCTVEGKPTSGVDSCEKGAMCWNVDPETSVGVCVGLCEGNANTCTREPGTCCPAGSGCTTSAAGILYLCLQICHPLLQDCVSPHVCYPVSSTFQCAPDLSGDMGAIGDPCEFINVCDPGSFCGDPGQYPGCDPEAGGCCIPFCPLDMPECAPGTECLPWYDPMDAPPGFENLGACLIP